MTDAFYKLAAWFSPAYPVGAFAYSHGLEWAIEAGDVADGASLEAWIRDCLAHGAGRNDAILLAHAWRAPQDESLAELADALSPTKERLLETTAQGTAFASTTAAAWGPEQTPAPYPIAVGRAAAAHDAPLELTLVHFLQAFAAMLVSAGVRLVPLGQTEGQQIQATLMPLCQQLAREAMDAGLDDLGGCAFRADIASMRHETQSTRLFRS